MSVVEGTKQGDEDLDATRRIPVAKRCGVSVAEARDDVLERLSVDVFHDEEELAALVEADVVDWHDARMIELTDDANLIDEAHHGTRAASGKETLACNFSPDVAIVDDAGDEHAASLVVVDELAQAGELATTEGDELAAYNVRRGVAMARASVVDARELDARPVDHAIVAELRHACAELSRSLVVQSNASANREKVIFAAATKMIETQAARLELLEADRTADQAQRLALFAQYQALLDGAEERAIARTDAAAVSSAKADAIREAVSLLSTVGNRLAMSGTGKATPREYALLRVVAAVLNDPERKAAWYSALGPDAPKVMEAIGAMSETLEESPGADAPKQ